MKNLTFSILLLSLSVFAQAGELIDQSLEVPEVVDVSIEDPHGQFEIHGWNKDQVKVTGEISDQAKGYSFEMRGNDVRFEVEYDSKLSLRDSIKEKDISKLKFFVPLKSRLDVSNVIGDITVMEIEGGTSIESVNGNITAEKLKQRISLETINGDITTKSIDGKIDIETINGNLTDKDSSGDLKLSSVQGNIRSDSHYTSVEIEIVNGNIDLQLDNIDELEIESVNGKVDVVMNLNKRGEVSVSNVNGSINLKFNKDVSADFQISTVVSGSIVNKLTKDQPKKQKFNLGRRLSFSKDGGSGRVSVSTVSGSVQIGAR